MRRTIEVRQKVLPDAGCIGAGPRGRRTGEASAPNSSASSSDRLRASLASSRSSVLACAGSIASARSLRKCATFCSQMNFFICQVPAKWRYGGEPGSGSQGT